MGNGPGKIGRERAPLNAEGDFDVEALPHKSESECASAMPPDVWRGLPRREAGGEVLGLCPWCGLCPSILGKAPNQ